MKFIKQQRETRNIIEIYNGTDPRIFFNKKKLNQRFYKRRPLPLYAKSVNTNISPYKIL